MHLVNSAILVMLLMLIKRLARYAPSQPIHLPVIKIAAAVMKPRVRSAALPAAADAPSVVQAIEQITPQTLALLAPPQLTVWVEAIFVSNVKTARSLHPMQPAAQAAIPALSQ